MTGMLRVHRIIPRTRVEGPGLRFCIWVQGCHHRCEGCFARDTWDPDMGREVSVENVIAQLRGAEGIQGITLLGGEPMEQAEGLCRVADAARAAGLSVITFTGDTYEDLLARKDPAVTQLLALTDVLVDGPYRKEEPEDTRPLVGSKNQRFLFLTDRYCQADMDALRNAFEVRVDEKGRIQINGMGDLRKLRGTEPR